MSSAVPQEIRPSGAMNRWTLEPLFSLVYILALASGVLAFAFAAAGLDAAPLVVVVILLWTAAVVASSRVRAARNAR